MAFDAIRNVFTPAVRARWRSETNPSSRLQDRLHALDATGIYPSAPEINHRVRHWRARKAAWDVYLTAGFACGLFEGKHGEDVRQRLTGVDDDNFRSAMSECLTCWFFAGKLRLSVDPWPKGQKGRVPDLLVHTREGELHVEVKAPYVAPVVANTWWGGNDAHVLGKSLKQASKQFARERRNLLVLVPSLRIPVYAERHQLIEAFFGTVKIVVPIDLTGSGQSLPGAHSEFFPDGHFLKVWKDERHFTRVGGVLCIEERIQERGDSDSPDWQLWVDHSAVVVHNPYSRYDVSSVAWEPFPQLIEKDGGMGWSDGKPVFR